jgi:flagellar basal body-associated protein FliL
MEGGVAIFLLLVLVVVAIVAVVALYFTGGAILTGRNKDEGPPPVGETHPVAENTTAMHGSAEREREHAERS